MFRWCALLSLGMVASAVAQQAPGLPLPRLDSISPLGGKVGTPVPELTLTGTDLEETTTLLFNHPGLKAEVIPPPPPKVDPKDPKKQPMPPKGPLPPDKFKITIAADVPPGQYDLRVVNKYGISNPRTFVVGDQAEAMEKEPNNDVPEAMKLDLNTTVNGGIASPTDVDLYAVTAKKGQRLLASVLANSIDSKARPLVEIYTATGTRLASHNGPDALADATIPADGEYFIRIAEFTYTTGGPQHFYRLTVSTNPWIDGVYPPTVEPGKPAQVTLYGRNLPGGTPEPGAFLDGRPLEKLVVTVNAPAESSTLNYRSRIEPAMGGTDGFEYRIKGPGGVSNPILIGFATDKVLLEKEPNDKTDQATEVAVPCEVAGRVDKRNDRDFFVFTAKKGESFMIDLWADRLGKPADFLFTVRAATAKTDMIEKDDDPEILSRTQFYSRTTDPEPYKFTAPEDGKYIVQVGCRESSYLYGPTISYRLRIAPERPDFRLVAMPASTYAPDVTVLRSDSNNYLEVFAFRYDGYNGPITLTAEGLPAGVTVVPQTVNPGQRSGSLILAAAPGAAVFNGPVKIKGTATINGKPVVREARSATITWATQQQQNTPTITRLDGALMLAVRPENFFRVTAEPQNAFIKMGEKLPQPLVIKQGDKLTVPFKVNRISPDVKVPITLQQKATTQNPQQMPLTVNNGQALPPVAADKTDGTFVIDAKATAPPGVYTIVLRATAQIQYDKNPMGKKKATTVEQAVSPIIVQVLPLSLAKVTATPMGNLKGGADAQVVVKVERQYDFAGEYKVKLVLPMNTKGITAEDITIPAGQTEVKVTLKAAADVPAGQLQNITAQVTAMYEGKTAIVSEAKFNLTVEKAPAPKKEEPKKK